MMWRLLTFEPLYTRPLHRCQLSFLKVSGLQDSPKIPPTQLSLGASSLERLCHAFYSVHNQVWVKAILEKLALWLLSRPPYSQYCKFYLFVLSKWVANRISLLREQRRYNK